MKCEIVRDLLPLYVDGLTSEVTSKEIDRHLKSCKECRMYYQEMAGEIPDTVPISEEELRDVELLRKIKRKNRWRVIGLLAGGFLTAAGIFCLMFPLSFRQVRYDEVKIDYGVRGNTAYCSLEAKPGYEICVSGESRENTMDIKILSVRKLGGSAKDNKADKAEWENVIGTDEDPCRWRIEFRDKVIVIENGQLVEEKNL